MALAPERVKYYDDIGEMVGTEGWKDLCEQLKREVYEKQADALSAPNWGRVCELRGEANALAVLVNLKEMTAMQKANEEADSMQGSVESINA